VVLDPSPYPSVCFLWHLPEEAVRLAFKKLKFGSRNTVGEDFGLCYVVAATDVRIPDDDKRRDLHLAKAVGRFPVMPSDAKLKIVRQLGVSGPSRLIKSTDAIRMALAKVGSKVGLGITDIVPDKFLKSHFNQFQDKEKLQAGNTICPGPCGRA